MFTKARVKLTALYLLTIMTISLSFSAVFYKVMAGELHNRLSNFQERLQLRQLGYLPDDDRTELFIEDLEESKSFLLLTLAYANIAIIIFSAAAGYFLAGKTLMPIERSLEEQKRFFADASHQLKTPLTSIYTLLEVALRDKNLKLSEAKSIIKESLEEIKSLSSLSNHLLNLSLFDQQKRESKKEKVNIKRIINSACKKTSYLSQRKNIQIIFKSSNTTLIADRQSLEKLFIILLENAFKYTPRKGKVWISAKKVKRSLVAKVKDSGIGINEKDLPFIFERFYRADNSRSGTKTDGFGLGLAMAKQIVNLHKGSIKAESEYNKGSTFTIKIPLNL